MPEGGPARFHLDRKLVPLADFLLQRAHPGFVLIQVMFRLPGQFVGVLDFCRVEGQAQQEILVQVSLPVLPGLLEFLPQSDFRLGTGKGFDLRQEVRRAFSRRLDGAVFGQPPVRRQAGVEEGPFGALDRLLRFTQIQNGPDPRDFPLGTHQGVGQPARPPPADHPDEGANGGHHGERGDQFDFEVELHAMQKAEFPWLAKRELHCKSSPLRDGPRGGRIGAMLGATGCLQPGLFRTVFSRPVFAGADESAVLRSAPVDRGGFQ